MSALFRTRLAAATVLAGCLGSGALHAATIPDNVAPWVKSAVKSGAAPAGRQVTIVVHMALTNVAALEKLIAEVSTPTSAAYGHYLTPAAFRARYAPDAADVAAARAMLENAGMTDITVGPGGIFITATATVAQIRSAFGVSQSLYGFRGHTLRANAEAPTIPDALAGKILSIEGLDDSGVLRTPQHKTPLQNDLVAPAGYAPGTDPASITPPPVAANNPSPYCSTYFGDVAAQLSTKPGPYPGKMPWLVCGYTPQQIHQAYGINKVKFDGKGVRVAIIDAFASPTIEADGNAYAKNHGLPKLTAANFAQLVPQGIYGVNPNDPCGPYGWWGEESLDVAAVHGSAPGASILYIGASDCNASLSVALENAIYNQQADILTNSYSFGGDADSAADIAAQTQAFMAADAMGITVLFSSGDDGDLNQVNGVATASFESDSPYVTGVGGTSLAVYGPTGRKNEWGWGTYRDTLNGVTIHSATSVTTSGLTTATIGSTTYYDFAFYSGSGGGISLLSPQPAYQAGIVPTSLATTLWYGSGYSVPLPNPQRVAPDISMVGDPYTGYLYGETETIAGNPISDHGCTPLTSTTEYCEESIGGTSLSSPLTAGVMAIVDQARLAAGKPVVGFANPWLYGAKIGNTLQSAGINDVLPPAKPTAVLRGYVSAPTTLRVVTMNSVPFLPIAGNFNLEVCATTICEGLDDVFNFTTTGYDDVTGLGVPYVPYLVTQ